ncbi:MAG: DNA repair protein [Symploca sp. SIO1A3]|nr:DNA repair protein [Symploca sp. SIO1A3]
MDISAERMMVSKEQVLAILLMRFNIKPSKAIAIAQEWLRQHRGATWETLKNLLNQNQVTVSEEAIRDITQSIIPDSYTKKYKGVEDSKLPRFFEQLKDNTSQTIKRKYRGVEYN